MAEVAGRDCTSLDSDTLSAFPAPAFILCTASLLLLSPASSALPSLHASLPSRFLFLASEASHPASLSSLLVHNGFSASPNIFSSSPKPSLPSQLLPSATSSPVLLSLPFIIFLEFIVLFLSYLFITHSSFPDFPTALSLPPTIVLSLDTLPCHPYPCPAFPCLLNTLLYFSSTIHSLPSLCFPPLVPSCHPKPLLLTLPRLPCSFHNSQATSLLSRRSAMPS